MKGRCWDCVFSEDVTLDTCTCHRHAPRPVVELKSFENPRPVAWWPEVSADDCCGDFVKDDEE
jgi:hypothetical protein